MKTSRYGALIAQGVVLSFSITLLAGCFGEDFKRIEDWEDDRPSVIPTESASLEGYRDSGRLHHESLMATVTVLNFQFETLGENSAVSYAPQNVLREALSRVPQVVKDKFGEQIGCQDLTEACLLNHIRGLVRAHGPRLYQFLQEEHAGFQDLLFAAYSSDLDRAAYRQRLWWALEEMRTPVGDRKSLGSGFFLEIDDELYVLSNNHVVERNFERLDDLKDENARKYTILYHDRHASNGRTTPKVRAEATLVARDPYFDVSLLRVDDQELRGKVQTLDIADDKDSKVGDHVLAVGSPRGLTATITSGIISNGQRYFDGIFSHTIQHTALIQPGNSGGPLVNMEGDVIGLNTFMVFGEYALSIPSSVIRDRLIDRMKQRNQSYYESSVEFGKVPYTAQEEILKLYFKSQAYDPSLNEATLFFAQDFNSQPVGVEASEFKEYAKPTLRLGALISKYRVDGVERPLVSTHQMTLDASYARNNVLEAFVLDREGTGIEGNWVPVPMALFDVVDERSFVNEVVSGIESKVRVANAKIQSEVDESLKDEEKRKKLSYFKLEHGNFVELSIEGKNRVFYIGNNGELWIIDALNYEPVPSIQQVRAVIGDYLSRFGENDRLPPFTLEYRNLKTGLTAYKRHYLRTNLDRDTDPQQKETVHSKVVDSVRYDREFVVVKIMKDNLQKLVAQYDASAGKKDPLPDRASPQLNESRLFDLVVPWAYSSLYTLYGYYNSEHELDGTSTQYDKMNYALKYFADGFSYKKKNRLGNCFKSLRMSTDFGMGTASDMYRVCFDGSSLVKAGDSIQAQGETSLVVLENRFPFSDSDRPDRDRFGLEHESFGAFSKKKETKIAEFIRSVKTHDAGSSSFPSGIRRSFFTGAEEGHWFWKGWKNPAEMSKHFVARSDITSGLRRYGMFASPIYANEPYISDVGYEVDNGLFGEIFDIAPDEKGEMPEKLNFHLFVPKKRYDINRDEVLPKPEWDEENLKKIVAAEGSVFGINPDLLVTVVDLNLDVFREASSSDTASAVRPLQAKLYLFHKKDPQPNELNYQIALAVEFRAEDLFMKGGRDSEGSYLSTYDILRGAVGEVTLTKAEKKRNVATRWAFTML